MQTGTYAFSEWLLQSLASQADYSGHLRLHDRGTWG